MSNKTGFKKTLSDAASVVRNAGRVVRAKVLTSEYLKSTVSQIVDQLEDEHPGTGLGSNKLRLARILLNRILGRGNVEAEWDFIQDLIKELVIVRKLETK